MLSFNLFFYYRLSQRGRRTTSVFGRQQKPEELKDEPEPDDLTFLTDDTARLRTTIEYPIIAYSDRERPQELMISHLSTGMPESVMQIINRSKLTKNLKFICFARTHTPSLHTEIHFLAFDTVAEVMFLYTIRLKKSFLRSSFSDKLCWQHGVISLGKKAKELFDERESILQVFFFKSQERSIGLIYQT